MGGRGQHWPHSVGSGPGQVPTSLPPDTVPCWAVQTDPGGLVSRTCMAPGFLEEAGRILCLDRRWTCQCQS